MSLFIFSSFYAFVVTYVTRLASARLEISTQACIIIIIYFFTLHLQLYSRRFATCARQLSLLEYQLNTGDRPKFEGNCVYLVVVVKYSEF